MTSAAEPPAEPPTSAGGAAHVVATAGHVDHGKSALVHRLTGMDPDRLEEEKRRGLTIDLGFAWTTLPSGREIGLVDVPGHERLIRTMLAGMGPVRLVLFVVAADEGWKPQSEEHLQIVDVLGPQGALVVLTKRDLVDDAALAARRAEVHDRLADTSLAGARVVACSSHTGEGIDDVRTALDDMVGAAPDPESTGRPRLFVDRVFTIRGAGTVVTGTLTGGELAVGDEAALLPAGVGARIRGLQTHKQPIERARAVSRVAVNLVGTTTADIGRGDVLALPGQWRAVSSFDAWIEPVRGRTVPLSERGAFKIYAGSAERDARLRLYPDEDAPGNGPPRSGVPRRRDPGRLARITLAHPLVLDLHERFVVRDSGRRATVAGGRVVDPFPPGRARTETAHLRELDAATREEAPAVLLARDEVVRADELRLTTGVATAPAGATPAGGWLLSAAAAARATETLLDALDAYHRDHPLRTGMDVAQTRAALTEAHPAFADPALSEAFVVRELGEGRVAREGTAIRRPAHRVRTQGTDRADRLVAAVGADELAPPTLKELAVSGFDAELVQAVCAEGRLVRVGPDLVMTPAVVARAEAVAKGAGPDGLTVSAFRQSLGTSRKYAVPLLELLDARGVTRRVGDVRVPRG
ncbi:MAG TPA: selenocysteine-specific translation elongation factor [Actinomycetota bacterium]|nr:selenocysteine-specific translation elongation factor [Actinomycetota bacterium]